jgi:hypothetical protein
MHVTDMGSGVEDAARNEAAHVLAENAYLSMEQAGGPTVLGCCAHVLLSAAEAGIMCPLVPSLCKRLTRLYQICVRCSQDTCSTDQLAART